METNLAREVKKYRKAKGNKQVYSNGMSQDQLAQKMGQILYDRYEAHFYPSILSHVVNGKRLFTVPQYEAFCDALDLQKRDRRVLWQALSVDRTAKGYDVDLDLSELAEDLDYAKNTMASIYRVRIAGNSQTAIQMLDDFFFWLDPKAELATPATKQEIRRLQGVALFEKYIGYTEIAPRPVVRRATWPVIKHMRSIAKEMNNEELAGLADFSDGNIYYIRGHYEEAIPLLTRAVARIGDVDYRLWALRALGLSLGYLKEAKDFQKVAEKVRSLVLDNEFRHLERVSETLEGIGRGEGLLKLPAAFDTLDKGYDFFTRSASSGLKVPLRAVQLREEPSGGGSAHRARRPQTGRAKGTGGDSTCE